MARAQAYVSIVLLLAACTGADDDGKETAEPAPTSLGDAGAALRGDAGDLAGAALGVADLDGDGAEELLVGALGGRVVCAAEAPFAAGAARGACLGQEAAYDFLGQSVAGGDVDGDGVGEVLVGGPGSDATAADAGKVWLVAGALAAGETNVADAAVAAWTGEAAGDQAGYAVAFAGDTDGDGDAELIVGAPGSDRGGREGGAVYLVGAEGGALADAPVIVTGEPPPESPAKHAENVLGDGVGSASCGGDLDGDGLADLAIGVPGWDGGAENGGAFAILRGPVAAGAWSVDAFELVPATRAGGYLGGAIACGGDTDGDGLGEVLAGADADEGGRVYLWRGGALDGGVIFTGAGTEQAGYAVAFVGEGGVAIGAASADDPEVDVGAVALFTGARAAGTYTLADADARWVGEAAGDYAGSAIVGLADIDGAGTPGLAAGAPYNADPAPIGGAVYVVPLP